MTVCALFGDYDTPDNKFKLMNKQDISFALIIDF